MFKICPTLIFVCLLFTPVVDAKMYKWVDDEGQVHYTDKVPTKYLKKKREELNELGATVKSIERAMTEEEKAQRRQQEKERKEEEKVRREQERRDRILTDTYTTERDLVAARDARLEAIDSQINLAESIVKDSQRKLKITEETVAQWKAQGKQVPDTAYAKLERERLQLETQKGAAQKHRFKRQEIVDQFDGYIYRFRELMEARAKGKAVRSQ